MVHVSISILLSKGAFTYDVSRRGTPLPSGHADGVLTGGVSRLRRQEERKERREEERERKGRRGRRKKKKEKERKREKERQKRRGEGKEKKKKKVKKTNQSPAMEKELDRLLNIFC